MSPTTQTVAAARRPARTAPRTLADAIRSATARGRLDAALQEARDALEQPASRRRALRRLISTRRSVCAPEVLPRREGRALGAVFACRLRQALRQAG